MEVDHRHEAVVAERPPTTKFDVEEGSEVFILPILSTLRLCVDEFWGGSCDGYSGFAVLLDESEADDALVHQILCELRKRIRLEIGAGITHNASDLVRD